MAELDSTQTDAMFSELMAGTGLDQSAIAMSDLRVVPMDFKRVGLNLLEGEELHESLIDVRGNVISFLASIGAVLDYSQSSNDLMIDAMEKRASQGRNADAFEKLFAIEGSGWFGIAKPGKKELGNGLLDHKERLFGVLRGIGYGKYQEATPEAIRLCQEEHIKPEVASRVGAFIGLTEARVCRGELDGLGEVDERYDRVVVPIDVTAFRWSRAYPLE